MREDGGSRVRISWGSIGIALVCLIMFCAGLNVGIHGVITLDDHRPRGLPSNSASDPSSLAIDNLPNELMDPVDHQASSDSGSDSSSSLGNLPPAVPAPPVPKQVREDKDKEIDKEKPKSEVEILIEGIRGSEPVQSAVSAVLLQQKDMEKREMQMPSSHNHNITDFIKRGGKIPVVLLTCNRPALLDGTLHSILQVEGVDKSNLIIMQDGALEEVSNMGAKYGVTVHQNRHDQKQSSGQPRLRGASMDGASRIATHYKFALSKTFELRPEAPAVIIIEDDLLFSPDFYTYFHENAALLEQDNSLFIISAWNDNGFAGKVSDTHALQRTEFFPGLGWLLPRALYENELERLWPRTHWDHWLRSSAIGKGREIAYPQVPRTFHNGIKGTFMDVSTHNKYFRDIAYNRRDVRWAEGSNDNGFDANGVPSYVYTTKSVYDARITEQVKQCYHVQSVTDFLQDDAAGKLYCIWIDLDPNPPENRPQLFKPIGEFFGIWHEHKRGAHRGVHEFYWYSRYIMIINVFDEKSRPHLGGGGYSGAENKYPIESFAYLRPPGAKITQYTAFRDVAVPESLLSVSGSKVTIIKADGPGISCVDTCLKHGEAGNCISAQLPLLNSCEVMQKYFQCGTCTKSVGPDQPAYKPDSSECLFTELPRESTCHASHPLTTRLCPCE